MGEPQEHQSIAKSRRHTVIRAEHEGLLRAGSSSGLLYASAAAGAALAAWLAWLLRRAFGAEFPPYITFYPVIILVALFGGTGAGLLTTALSVAAVAWLFPPPAGSLAVHRSGEVASLILFGAINVTTSMVAGSLRRARYRSREQARVLSRTVDMLDLANVLVRDAEDRIVRWNTGCQRLYGYTPEQALGKVSHQLLHTRFPAPLADIRAELLRTGRWKGELRHTAADSRELVVSSEWVLRTEDGDQPSLIIEVNADVTERRAAEAARDTMAAIIAETEDAVISKDLNAQLTSWNKGAERLFGYSAEQAIGKNLFLLIPPDRQEEEEAVLASIRRGESVRHYETQWVACDGRRLEVSVATSPLRDSAGHVVGAAKIIRDITRRKQAEEALRHSMDQYERQVRLFEGVASTTPDFVYIFDLRGRFLYANRRLLEVWGMKLPEVIGKTCRELGYEQWHHDMHMREIAQVIQTKHPIKGEVPFKAPLTGIFGVYEYIFTPIVSPDGEVEFVAGTTRDITERKRAEDALRESEARFRTLADNMSQLAWMADPSGWVFWYNRRWFEYTGASVEEMRGWGWQKVSHPDHVQRVTEKFRLHLQSGEPWEDTFPLRGRDGSYRWFLTRAVPIRDEAGAVLRWFGTNTDVTEQREAQQALAQSRQELERVVEERTARLREMVTELEHFSYTITHDMRAPLRAMRGLASLLVEECGLELQGERLEYLQRIADSAERMDQLITDSLQYSLLVRGQFQLEPVDADALLRGILESYPQFHPPHAYVRIGNRLPVVLANKAGLTQCFSNLLGNAVKFVHPGQKAEVLVRAEQPADEASEPKAADAEAPVQQTAASSPLSSWHVPEQTGAGVGSERQHASRPVRIWFEDKGIGIKKEYHDKVWVMFQRLNKSYAGTGIGLALVRKAVERMGGRVGLESEPGRGSRFWVELQSPNGKSGPEHYEEMVRHE